MPVCQPEVAMVLAAEGLTKRFGTREALRGRLAGGRAGRAGGGDRPQRRGQDHAPVDPRRASSGPTRAASRARPSEIGWVPQQAAVYGKLTVRENLELFARLEKVADPAATVERMLELTGLGDRADDQVGSLSGGNRQRVNIAVGLLGAARGAAARRAQRLAGPSPAGAAVGVHPRAWPGRARPSSTPPTTSQEAERHANRVVVLADGELLFSGSPGELEERGRARPPRRATSSRPSSPSSTSGATSRALAAAQGPEDPQALAAAGGAARALPGDRGGADRLRALARPGQARGGLLQRRAAAGRASSSWAAPRSTSPTRPTRCSRRSTRCG